VILVRGVGRRIDVKLLTTSARNSSHDLGEGNAGVDETFLRVTLTGDASFWSGVEVRALRARAANSSADSLLATSLYMLVLVLVDNKLSSFTPLITSVMSSSLVSFSVIT